MKFSPSGSKDGVPVLSDLRCLHGGVAALIFLLLTRDTKNFQKAIEAAKLNYTTDRRKEAAKKAWEKRRANAAVVK